MQKDRKSAYTPAARYYVKECSKDKLVLSREEVNMGGPNLIEGDVVDRETRFLMRGVYNLPNVLRKNNDRKDRSIVLVDHLYLLFLE